MYNSRYFADTLSFEPLNLKRTDRVIMQGTTAYADGYSALDASSQEYLDAVAQIKVVTQQITDLTNSKTSALTNLSLRQRDVDNYAKRGCISITDCSQFDKPFIAGVLQRLENAKNSLATITSQIADANAKLTRLTDYVNTATSTNPVVIKALADAEAAKIKANTDANKTIIQTKRNKNLIYWGVGVGIAGVIGGTIYWILKK